MNQVANIICRIPRIETRGIWGRKGKKDPQQVPHDARTPTTTGKTNKNVYSTSVGSAALPGSEASDYTYTKVHEKINHYNKAEKTRETPTRQRSEKTEERECNSAREEKRRQESGDWLVLRL